jgi:hypothetical protein
MEAPNYCQWRNERSAVLQLRDDVCSNVGTNAKLSSVFEKANTNAAYP